MSLLVYINKDGDISDDQGKQVMAIWIDLNACSWSDVLISKVAVVLKEDKQGNGEASSPLCCL